MKELISLLKLSSWYYIIVSFLWIVFNILRVGLQFVIVVLQVILTKFLVKNDFTSVCDFEHLHTDLDRMCVLKGISKTLTWHNHIPLNAAQRIYIEN